ncbi:PHD finger protein 23B-like [Contarinia nasturtii]|uniref:PHD finger protein 23B-like n=1 Tax=Contarinia nasturtii TaxID=265458 RepID=UPI0012D40F1E|nr:PHD finger protein 23B-like [Contarinia nasturtii]
MSINVDKMDPKHNNSMRKSKPVMKRRKKLSTASDLSSDSLSPKKRPPNGYGHNDYRSSPETTFSSSYHNILPDSMNGLSVNGTSTTNRHHHIDGANYFSETINGDSNRKEIVSQNGLVRSMGSDSSSHTVIVNRHRYDDSDSASSVTRSIDGASSSGDGTVGHRQPRTPEDFYLFCQFILEYENYGDEYSQDALRSSNHSPLDSTGSATESTTSSAVNEDESNHAIPIVDTTTKDLDTNDLNGTNVMLNDTSTDDVTKSLESTIDASSTNEDDDSDIDADSYNLITCYCGKPYAARPMIECSQCLTWLHLSCAKIKRKNIPDIFICVKCAKTTGQQSSMTQQSMPNHPKDLQSNEQPKENNRSKKSTALTTASQTRSDKLENNILQPLNVSATAYETGANNLDNIKQTTSTVSNIAVKYK